MTEVSFSIVSLWRRSDMAEGNPMHKPQTRERIDANDEPVDVIPIEGLVCSSDWHRDRQVKERNHIPDPENRAILFQSEENARRLVDLFPDLPNLKEGNQFGENIVVRCDSKPDDVASQTTCDVLCLGDELEVRRGEEVSLRLVISSPRWPCYKLDKRAGCLDKELKKRGESVQGVCVNSGLGGVFCKVLDEGTLACGDRLFVVKRPHPQWTLRRVSEVCYGGRNRITCLIGEFQGTRDEFEELMRIEELARFEWRDRLERCEEKRLARENSDDADVSEEDLHGNGVICGDANVDSAPRVVEGLDEGSKAQQCLVQ